MKELMEALAKVICRVIDYHDVNSIKNEDNLKRDMVELGEALEAWEGGA